MIGQIYGIVVALLAVSAWTILTSVAPILAPIIALVLTLIGRLIWNHEQRIRALERGETRQSRTLYGDKDDPQQDGLAQDITHLGERVDQLEQTIGELRDEIHELNGRNK